MFGSVYKYTIFNGFICIHILFIHFNLADSVLEVDFNFLVA